VKDLKQRTISGDLESIISQTSTLLCVALKKLGEVGSEHQKINVVSLSRNSLCDVVNDGDLSSD
jgi:hypothetical protein